jgi:hypothetical protein
MSSRWVDSEAYIGVDRRDDPDKRRLFGDRRRARGAYTEPPSVETMIRQLRSSALGLHTRAHWERFQVRLEGAIGLARMQSAENCAQILTQLRQSIDTARVSPLSPATVEQYLERARYAATRTTG